VRHSIISVLRRELRRQCNRCVLFPLFFRGAVWIQTPDPSLTTLLIRSTGNQYSNCDPAIFAIFIYRFGKLCVFFWCPFTLLLVKEESQKDRLDRSPVTHATELDVRLWTVNKESCTYCLMTSTAVARNRKVGLNVSCLTGGLDFCFRFYCILR
jgi:hypothetical protein